MQLGLDRQLSWDEAAAHGSLLDRLPAGFVVGRKLIDNAEQLAESVFANNPWRSFRNAKSGELFDLAECHSVSFRRRFGQ